jgi:hypothetical protein
MSFSLLVFALAATFLFSMIFIPVFFAAWRQEEEYWKRRTRQFTVSPLMSDRHGQWLRGIDQSHVMR